MGEIAEMMLDGTLCECCGQHIDFGEAEGFPRYCSPSCAADRGVDFSEQKDDGEEDEDDIESIEDMEQISFLEALEYINNGNRITYMTREDWPYKLFFCPNSQNLMIKLRDEVIPYVISTFDFDYEWEICEN